MARKQHGWVDGPEFGEADVMEILTNPIHAGIGSTAAPLASARPLKKL